jgi:hypothetical protein
MEEMGLANRKPWRLARGFSEKRIELALWRARRGAWEQLGWLEKTNVPRGLGLAASMTAMGICRLTSAVSWRILKLLIRNV